MLAPQKQFRMVPDHESGNNLKQKSNQNFTMRFQETVSTELNMLMRLTQISDRISGERKSAICSGIHITVFQLLVARNLTYSLSPSITK
jgi:hypothetical protein